MSIFRQKGRQNNAKVFLKDFDQTSNTYFIGVGNSVTSPVEPLENILDTIEADQYTWDNMFFASQLTRDDLSLMIPEYTGWPARYEAFNKNKNQYENSEKFYAYNPANRRVYLCVDSPDNPNILSTVPPTGSSFQQLETTGDGYTWKFLYEIDEITLQKFQYPGFLPIKEVSTGLYTDERVLQQGVQASSVQGVIEAISVVSQGNAYLSAFNVNFSYTTAVMSIASSSPSNIIFSLSSSVANSFSDLNLSQDFYKDNYVINFENGYTAVIDKSYVDSSTGNFKIEICEDLVCSVTSTLPVGEKFRILPRIKIIGNGQGACAIPILGINKKLQNISIINGGENYSYSEAEILIQNGSILRPIVSLNGLASDITQLLGAKHVMISKKIIPSTVLDPSNPALFEKPENTGIVYTGSQYNNVISENTYYTQISLIKSPRQSGSTSFMQIVAGSTLNVIREMLLEAINPKVNIFIGNATTPYINSDNFFKPGDTLVRGPNSAPDQFRAIITNVTVGGDTTRLECDLINGAFDTYYGFRIKNLKFETDIANEDDDIFFTFTGCSGDCSSAIYATYENVFTLNDFKTDDALFGSESLQTVKIIKPAAGYSLVDPRYPNRVKINVLNPSPNFVQSRFEEDTYINGEIITGLKNNPDGSTSPTTNATLSTVSAPPGVAGDVTQSIFSCCYILECTIQRDGIDTPFQLVNSDNISLETNTLIRQGTDGAIGKIIRVALPGNTNSDKIYLYVNNYSKEFLVNGQNIYTINDLYDPTIYKNMKIVVSNIRKSPELIKYSGDLLYINSVGPVQRRLNNTEQVKLLVEF